MNQGEYVFAQLMSLADDNEFTKCVNRYNGNCRVVVSLANNQFLCLHEPWPTYSLGKSPGYSDLPAGALSETITQGPDRWSSQIDASRCK